jgi:uncharacterized protein (TIGR02145 family)
MTVFNRYRQALQFAAAIFAVMAVVVVSGCVKKVTAPTVETDSGVVASITVSSDTGVAAKLRRIDYGSLTDERDGKTYRTVKIGRRTWMAENLNYEPKDSGSSCRDNSAGNCEKYGRLYDWETARNACPGGWLLSSFYDWDALAAYASDGDKVNNVKKLKATSGWNYYEDNSDYGDYGGNGTDDYGFSALPGGNDESFWSARYYSFGTWWATTKTYDDAMYVMVIRQDNTLKAGTRSWNGRHSVRCVMYDSVMLTLTAGAGGTVSSNPRKTAFKAGETVTITATPKSGYKFMYWPGGKVAAPTAAVTTVTLRSDMDITAKFRAVPGVRGTFADKRDGQKYRTAQIGEQIWTAENLNYWMGNSWCYNDSDSYCDKYGRLYEWDAAKTACPAGWRLPSRADWDILAKAAGGVAKHNATEWGDVGKALKAKTGWAWNNGDWRNGTDDYGFAALPGGRRNTDDFWRSKYNDKNLGFEGTGKPYPWLTGVWWTSTEADTGDKAYALYMFDGSQNLINTGFDKKYGLSVRCVIDCGNKQASAQTTKHADGKDGMPEIKTVFVKGGVFTMGCTDVNDKFCNSDNMRAHNVAVGDFYIGKYEVTQKQWTAVMGGNPSAGPEGDDYPVNNISRDDIEEFIERLNAATGKRYRLPTEAEWEYAARGGEAGKKYRYSGSDNSDDVAWYENNSGGEAHPVGMKAPNELGLYDMTGNVWELVGDRWGAYGTKAQVNPTGPKEGAADVGRGGYWGTKAYPVYVRGYSSPGESSYTTGFRLVLPP